MVRMSSPLLERYQLGTMVVAFLDEAMETSRNLPPWTGIESFGFLAIVERVWCSCSCKELLRSWLDSGLSAFRSVHVASSSHDFHYLLYF